MAIESNQVVAMMYELKVDGEVVDSNIGKDPLEFTYGTGQIIPGLESRIVELNEGDSKDITVPAAEAYGEYNEEAKQVLPKEQFGDLELQVGMPLQGQGENGQPIQVIVTDIKEDGSVEVDFNHPLAGKELNFSITINSIN
ncbi:peptidylprolyl isomerase [Arcobacter sp. CECT 8989]|uniref:FKBP-type peptidyl-prolyl cis-trans isomerase n=1 Tax=Arcobacter sp. CECT 8989 TaxID=2044509 RepID=UPI00100AF17A|nr:peptidylprolyl isomerase [Arcobacter sp. CECT 8989]RXK03638.1 peptidylprolyl isomerase [Arcobacter sp. CECT 8989]